MYYGEIHLKKSDLLLGVTASEFSAMDFTESKLRINGTLVVEDPTGHTQALKVRCQNSH